jgi:hypothetical protein
MFIERAPNCEDGLSEMLGISLKPEKENGCVRLYKHFAATRLS